MTKFGNEKLKKASSRSSLVANRISNRISSGSTIYQTLEQTFFWAIKHLSMTPVCLSTILIAEQCYRLMFSFNVLVQCSTLASLIDRFRTARHLLNAQKRSLFKQLPIPHSSSALPIVLHPLYVSTICIQYLHPVNIISDWSQKIKN